MLGRLPTGSDAIAFRNTLFRVSELCWIKAVRLSIPEHIVRVVAVILAVAWVMAMKTAKGTYYNVEFLLAGLPLVLAWSMSSSLKIGCSGDFEETYEQRHGLRSSLFRGWIDALRDREEGWVHLQSSSYDMLFNPNRMAWIRPTIQWQLFPLIVTAVFSGYFYVIKQGFDIGTYPVISDFQILSWQGSRGPIDNLCYAVIITSVIAFILSIKRGVEICGTGGVQDTFPMKGADQKRLLELMAGTSSVKKVAKPAPRTQAVEVAPSQPSPEKKKPEKKAPVAKPVETTPVETPTQALATPGETKTAALPKVES